MRKAVRKSRINKNAMLKKRLETEEEFSKWLRANSIAVAKRIQARLDFLAEES